MGVKPYLRKLPGMDHIVVYEDDDLMRTLLTEWLGQAGYRVSAPAPREPPPELPADLVIVSISMPKHVGARMVREIQADHPGAPLIALSAQFRAGLCDVGASARILGVRQVMAKPLARDSLLESIRVIMGRQG